MTVVCTIIATAEYCSEVVGSLGRSIAKTLEAPYNEQVFLQLCGPMQSMLNAQMSSSAICCKVIREALYPACSNCLILRMM